MIMNEIAFIGLGSNIGDRESNIFSAIAALDVRNEINVKIIISREIILFFMVDEMTI